MVIPPYRGALYLVKPDVVALRRHACTQSLVTSLFKSSSSATSHSSLDCSCIAVRAVAISWTTCGIQMEMMSLMMSLALREAVLVVMTNGRARRRLLCY